VQKTIKAVKEGKILFRAPASGGVFPEEANPSRKQGITSGTIMKKVLVAEGDAFNQELTASVVESLGHVALRSSDGHVARHILDDNDDIALRITDVCMSEIDGLELLREMLGRVGKTPCDAERFVPLDTMAAAIRDCLVAMERS